MPAMFPGMNPYLEHPDLWPKIHPQFIAAMAKLLQQEISDRYSINIRPWIYRVRGEDSLVVGQPTPKSSPDTLDTNGSGKGLAQKESYQQPIPTYIAVPQTIEEDYIEVIDRQTDKTVTIIEVLTPRKKRPGRGRDYYEQRCEPILVSDTHFVEIDLLRGWEPISDYGPSDIDYRVLVSRSDQRPKADLYTWQVNEPIPTLTIPLNCCAQTGDTEQSHCTIDLKQALDTACAGERYVVNYERDPIPPLRPEASRWLATLLTQHDLRQASQITNRYDEREAQKF